MPSTIACSRAVPDTLALSLEGGLRVRRRLAPRRRCRQALHEVAVLPLEGQRLPSGVLPQRVELDRSLDTVERHAAVEVGHDFAVVEAVRGGDLAGDWGVVGDLHWEHLGVHGLDTGTLENALRLWDLRRRERIVDGREGRGLGALACGQRGDPLCPRDEV